VAVPKLYGFTKINLCLHKYILSYVFWYHAINLADWFALIIICWIWDKKIDPFL